MKKIYIFFAIILVITASFSVIKPLINSVSGEISTEKILIIDPGHGGIDGGAEGNLGTIESEINLIISKKGALICDFIGLNYVLTRDDEQSLDFNENVSIRENKISDTKARVSIVNSYQNAFLISIHLNKYTDSSPKGAQVFFNDFEKSLEYSNILQENIKNVLDNSNNRVAQSAPTSVYLIKNSKIPSVIFECGFLSNETEEKLLNEDKYQTKLAICMISSYLQLYKE